MLVDTHAHIHSKDYGIDPELTLVNAKAVRVNKILCVGTDIKDSSLAVKFAGSHDNCWASVGLHPHDAKLGSAALAQLDILLAKPKVVAVGECGLDYYYGYSPKQDQLKAFEHQLELAAKFNKPLIFHVREAFDDFFAVLKNHRDITGVVHSFSNRVDILERILDKGLYVGLNGIMTFTQEAEQLEAARRVPLDQMLLETDCPFLTPAPKRGTINEPANVRIIAEFIANLRGESVDKLAKATTHNAKELFKI